MLSRGEDSRREDEAVEDRLDDVDSRREDEAVDDRLDGQRAGHDEVRFADKGGWRRNDEAWVRIGFSRL